jgi:2-keto-3-deoxy-6-phosphogluconate aldolase
MASVQSDNGWTKTNLGDGWVKLTEVCDAFSTGGNDDVKTTAITNSTANAVTSGPSMPIINELKAAGEFIIEAVLGAGTVVADLHLYAKNSAGTYQVLSSDLVADTLTASSTNVVSYSGAITDGLKVVVEKDSGTAANTLTVSLIYYNGGPNMSNLTIGGVGGDPS